MHLEHQEGRPQTSCTSEASESGQGSKHGTVNGPFWSGTCKEWPEAGKERLDEIGHYWHVHKSSGRKRIAARQNRAGVACAQEWPEQQMGADARE